MDTLHLNQARPPAGHVGLEHILSQLRIAAYKHHICTADFFRDHDHLRSGIITRTQFERGLHFFLGRVTKLDSQDINMLTEAFSTSDGRVRYRDYCNAVENAFDGRHLEKAPMDSVICPSREELTTANQAKILTPKEEEEVDHILSRLAVIIRQRRLDAGPYFKDFEQSTAETHIITRTQFSRILHFLGLHVTSDELHLVCDKFVVGSNFVNYLLFVKAVEPGALGCRKRDSTKAAKVIEGTKSEQVTTQTSGIVDPNKFRIHLQKYLEVYGVRLQEFIRDFDPLRSGSVSTSVLRRAISMAGLRPEPSQAVFDAFASCYKDLRQPGYIRYNEMLAHLQLPIDNLGLRNGFHMPVPQHRHAEDLQEDQQGVLEKVLRHFKNTILQRRLNVEPLFREFDRHYKGCVSEFRLQQIISQLSVRVSEADVAVLLAAFPGGTTMTPQSVDNVFNYRTFLERLESMDKRPSPYQERTDRCSTGMRRETSPNCNRRPHCSSVQDPPRCDVQL